MSRSLLVCLLLLSIGLVGCNDDNGPSGNQAAAAWSYDGDIGPEHWGDLSAAYATCSAGRQQSPIDIVGVTASLEPALKIGYQTTPLVIFNDGHTVEVEYHQGGTLTVGDHTWEVVQFHFHAHSEHTVDGMFAPMELHVVHRDADGGLAVVGAFILEGAENAALATVFDHLPAEVGEPVEIEGAEVDVGQVLPTDLSAWRYDGSLTTPPCTEGVRWYVLATPIEASAAQIDAFEAIFDHNSRPTQPLNGRTIE